MENKGVLEPLWKHLRPVSQRRLRMTSQKIRNMTKNWKDNIPDIKELENKDKFKIWKEEATVVPYTFGKEKRWRWKYMKVSLEIIFTESDKYSPHAKYYISDNSSYNVFINDKTGERITGMTKMSREERNEINKKLDGKIFLIYNDYIGKKMF